MIPCAEPEQVQQPLLSAPVDERWKQHNDAAVEAASAGLAEAMKDGGFGAAAMAALKVVSAQKNAENEEEGNDSPKVAFQMADAAEQHAAHMAGSPPRPSRPMPQHALMPGQARQMQRHSSAASQHSRAASRIGGRRRMGRSKSVRSGMSLGSASRMSASEAADSTNPLFWDDPVDKDHIGQHAIKAGLIIQDVSLVCGVA